MAEPTRDGWFFDGDEGALVAEALEAIGKSNAKQRVVLEGILDRLRRMAALVRDSPSIASSWDGGGTSSVFSASTLIEQLCRIPDYDLDLHVPTKAIFGQAYIVAKINLLKALGYSLGAIDGQESLRARMEHEIAQSIYTKLAEELFLAIVTDSTCASTVKTGAGRFLFRIWEQRLLIEVDDFAPVLESAWVARSKLLPVLGTMLGTHEMFRLFQQTRDSRFLDYFGEDEVGEEEILAFEEFLFGLSYEEITQLRAHLTDEGRACITLEAARTLLGHVAPPPSRQTQENAAHALYTSYKKRRVNAAHRMLTGAPGPKKTAEECFMIAFLHSGASPSDSMMRAATPVPPP